MCLWYSIRETRAVNLQRMCREKIASDLLQLLSNSVPKKNNFRGGRFWHKNDNNLDVMLIYSRFCAVKIACLLFPYVEEFFLVQKYSCRWQTNTDMFSRKGRRSLARRMYYYYRVPPLFW